VEHEPNLHTPGGGVPHPDHAQWFVGPAAEMDTQQPDDGVLWVKWFGIVFFLGACAYLTFMYTHVASGAAMFFDFLRGYGLLATAQAVLLIVYVRQSRHIDLGRGMRGLRATVPAEGACPVSVRIQQDGVFTGADEGFLWVEDGMVRFKGLHTFFRLRRDDVPPLPMWPANWRPKPNLGKPPTKLVIPTPERAIVLDIGFIDPFEDHETKQRTTSLQKAIYDWLVSHPDSREPTVLPPDQLHPALNGRQRTCQEGMVVGFMALMFDMAFLAKAPLDLSMTGTESLVSLLAIGVGSALAVATVRQCWQFLRDISVRSQIGPQRTEGQATRD